MAFVVTDAGRVALMQSFVGIASVPSAFYIALCTNLPDESADGTTLAQVEPPTGAGYARQSLPTGVGDWAESGFGVANLNSLTWGPATDDWGVIKSWALCSSLTGGEVYCAGDLPLSYRVLPPLVIELSTGALALEAESPYETVVT
jgi:hypothetical protein